MIIDELRRRAVARGGYEANIAIVIAEMEEERKSVGTSLAKISAVLRKQRREREKEQEN